MVAQVLIEQAQKKSGLILVAGDRFSKIDQSLSELTSQLKETGVTRGAYILRQSPQSFQIGSPFLLVQYGELTQPLVQKNLMDCDCLIFEKVMDFEELEWALQLAEEGRMVIIHMATASISSALHRVFSLWPAGQLTSWSWRFADQLKLILGQVCISQAQPEAQWAHEIALVSPMIKKYIRDYDLNSVETELKKAADKSGLVSLNQSLLQLLIRRKIDVKIAFETTRDPEDLDHLLKKVGI